MGNNKELEAKLMSFPSADRLREYTATRRAHRLDRAMDTVEWFAGRVLYDREDLVITLWAREVLSTPIFLDEHWDTPNVF